MFNNLKNLIITSLLCIVFATSAYNQQFGIAIHGGAGYITPENISADKADLYKAKLQEALDQGYIILEAGGTSEEAIVAAIKVMENSELFNAGKGSVLNTKGKVEMDASIMRGNDKNAGAVAGVSTVKNPILAAQLVMNKSKHVMLAGKGADKYAKDLGLQTESNKYFITARQKTNLKNVQEKALTLQDSVNNGFKYGTVGAVALDKHGNLAAATSTGGMTNKQHNRVGDSPIIGAGTYADNRGCAVSCTGHGEYFIRLGVAHQISGLVKLKSWDIQKSADYTIHKELEAMGAVGGVIVMDRRANVAFSFNTPGMFRGVKKSNGQETIGLFGLEN